MKKRPSITRLHTRELEKKLIPSIKLLSQYMFNTSPDAPKKDFFGYKLNSGTFTDSHGIAWQAQIHTYCTKNMFIKENNIIPIIRKGAILFRLRVFAKAFIDKIFD